MKISELTEKLEKLRAEHGDLEVEMFDDVYGFRLVETDLSPKGTLFFL